MKKKVVWVLVFVLLVGGIYFVVQGLSPYPVRDMNGDGVINWKDYDLNNDGIVDLRDIIMVAHAYGSSYGDSTYNQRCDFNGDGVIDDYDLNAIKDYYGQGLSLLGRLEYRLGTPKGIQFFIGLFCLLIAVFIWVEAKRLLR